MLELLDAPDLILIIDDSVDAILLLSDMLEGQGNILFATNGQAGIDLAKQRHPRLILLDVDMPGMNGYEVCRRLKADSDTQDCAIIFVTGNSSMESEVAALNAGAVDFITKPLNPPVVRARVRTHLNLQRNTQALAQLASRDGLTRLFNRRYFDEQLTRELERHKRQRLPLGLAMIDIDHFKAYNDGYGHQQGDTCLIQVAKALCVGTRRPGEVIARYGGEEFVVILPYTSPDDAHKYGNWICELVRNLNIVHGFSTTSDVVTASVGVTSAIPNDKISVDDLIRFADQALYQAKSGGRNRCQYFDAVQTSNAGTGYA